MHFRITADTNAESGIGPIINSLSGPTRKHFLSKDYGCGLLGIGVVLMCRDPNLNFKRRVRFLKKEKKLYLDIMFDLGQMEMADPETRKNIVLEQIAENMPTVLRKYSIQDFDKIHFLEDLKIWLNAQQSGVGSK